MAAPPLLAAPTVLAFYSGAFFVRPQLVAAAAGCALLALLALTLPWPVLPGGWPLAALGGLAALAAWGGLSISWARLALPAAQDTDRVVMYVVLFTLALALMRYAGPRRAAAPALLAGVVIVCVYALAGRFLPHLVPVRRDVIAGARIDQPLTYWNATGMFAGIGALLAITTAGDERLPRGARALACASAVPCTLVAILSFSRGALLATVAGAVVAVLIRPRFAVAMAALIGGGAAVAASLTMNAFPAVLSLSRGASAQASEGPAVAAIALAATVAAGAAFALVARSPLAARVIPLSRRLRSAGVLVIVPLVLGLGSLVAASAEQTKPVTGSPARIATVKTIRGKYWKVALEAFAAHPLDGVGSGSFAAEWRRKRTSSESVNDAHSLYLETLAELGLVGALALALMIGSIAAGLRRVARAAPREPLLAAAGAVLAAYAIHAGLDWDWEMPAVTLPVLILAAAAMQVRRPSSST